MVETKRNRAFDLAKGLLIILVVIGHSGSFLTKYIFWFHMPAFFFISGLLFKEVTSTIEGKKYLIKKYKNYGFLYLSYFVFVIALSFLYIHLSDFSFYKTFLKLVIGGRFVGRELGVFWYISCLIFSLTIFLFILLRIKQKKYQYLVLIILYLLAHLEAYFQSHHNITFYVPLNIDVALLAVCYIGIGFYLKGWVMKMLNNLKLSMQVLAITGGICLLLIVLNLCNILNYQLDMKNLIYYSLLGDIIFPLVFTIFILSLCKFLDKSGLFKFLLYFGKYSIAIMFLHFSILEIYKHYFHYNWIIFSILGSLIPLLFAIACDKFKLTRILFLKGLS